MFFIHCFFALFARNKKFHAKAAKVSHAKVSLVVPQYEQNTARDRITSKTSYIRAIAKNLSAQTNPSLRYAPFRMTICREPSSFQLRANKISGVKIQIIYRRLSLPGSLNTCHIHSSLITSPCRLTVMALTGTFRFALSLASCAICSNPEQQGTCIFITVNVLMLASLIIAVSLSI